MNQPLWVRLPVTAVVIFLLAAAIVWIIGLASGWETVDYSNGMFIAGALAIVVAILSSFDGWGHRAGSKQMDGQAAGEMSLAGRARLWVQDLTRGYNAVLLMSIVGILLIGLSVLVGSFMD